MSARSSPTPQDELAFIKSHLATLSSLRVAYPGDYVPPLSELSRKPPSIPFEVIPPPEKAESTGPLNDSFQISIKSLKPPITFSVDVSPSDLISTVKERLAEQSRAPPADTQRLLLKGKALADGKLVKEYDLSSGSVVNLMIKPGVEWTGQEKPLTSPTKPSLHIDIKGTPAAPGVVVSSPPAGSRPSIPIVTIEGADVHSSPLPVPLDIVTGPPLGPQSQPAASSYLHTLCDPQFWVRLHAFLNVQFLNEEDADTAFEDFLLGSKALLSAGDIARIRDAVGISGMSGT